MDETATTDSKAPGGRAPTIATAPHDTPIEREEQVAQLADDLARLMRGLTRARAQLLAKARHDVEWAAQILISHLAAGGPMRLGALATSVQSDPSTVSRQIAALVRTGYVERRADPDDGRAVVLYVTEAGEQVYRDHLQVRNERYQGMLARWSSEDLVTFATMLRRFGDDMEAHQPAWTTKPTSALSGMTRTQDAHDAPSGHTGTGPSTREDCR
ncbi:MULTISPECIES: MarR family winged helix-turn-helix transcriptional regulator [Parafrankia]|uniref:Transcriptional regulator n=1 Tax=Parafrankia soli TaxID=2599596 RepID=A0A1S1PRE4_9ACTN|nr:MULTISPECIES: MarR family transcriptional regulator [Parafrankia]OHV23887.1 transcriptional regulator [Parafrankia soli]TCJ32971.1 MarR family transcriptional regulator [Parafrankia sp. BMG5.11]CAI7976711.1 Transcriptional regulator [Frankia sp. Hr75.2]SQD94475.1 Transcriptional regulator, MarR family [Parafrankia sp. Ea1.12]